MNTEQISTLCKSDPLTLQFYLGTFACDRLPSKFSSSEPFVLIANTDPEKHRGTHWIALRRKWDGKGEFFDSYGKPPQKEFAKFLSKNCKSYTHNPYRLQGEIASTCGSFAVCICLLWSRGYTLADILQKFDRCDLNTNDSAVTDVINVVFDTSFPVLDLNFTAERLLD